MKWCVRSLLSQADLTAMRLKRLICLHCTTQKTGTLKQIQKAQGIGDGYVASVWRRWRFLGANGRSNADRLSIVAAGVVAAKGRAPFSL